MTEPTNESSPLRSLDEWEDHLLERYPAPGAGPDGAVAHVHEVMQAFLQTSEGVELAEIFPRIASGRVRRQILDLVRTMAAEEDK